MRDGNISWKSYPIKTVQSRPGNNFSPCAPHSPFANYFSLISLFFKCCYALLLCAQLEKRKTLINLIKVNGFFLPATEETRL